MYLSSSEPTPLKLDARTKEKERNVTVRPTTTTTTTRLLRIAHSFVTSNAQTTFLLNQHKPPQKNLLSPQALAVAELRIAIHGSADESEAAIELLRRLRGQDAVELIGAGPRDAPDRRQFRLRARRRDAIGRSGAGPVRELELAADLLRGARRPAMAVRGRDELRELDGVQERVFSLSQLANPSSSFGRWFRFFCS